MQIANWYVSKTSKVYSVDYNLFVRLTYYDPVTKRSVASNDSLMSSLGYCFTYFSFFPVSHCLCLPNLYDFQIEQDSDIIVVTVIIYYLLFSALRFDNKYRNLEAASNAGTMSSTKGDDVMYTHGKSSHHGVAKSSTSRDSWGSDGDKKKLHVNDAMEYWRWRLHCMSVLLKCLFWVEVNLC